MITKYESVGSIHAHEEQRLFRVRYRRSSRRFPDPHLGPMMASCFFRHGTKASSSSSSSSSSSLLSSSRSGFVPAVLNASRVIPASVVVLCFLTAFIPPVAQGQQMDPAEMQRMIQQQMGGSPGGGGGGAPPNRIGQLVCAAGAGGVSVARSARRHPKAAVAGTAAIGAAIWAAKETRTSGLLVSSSPRVSIFRPSDVYLSAVLEEAAEAPVASPLQGVILSPLGDPEAEEEHEEREEGGGIDGGHGKERGPSGRRRVGGGKRSSGSNNRLSSEGEAGAGRGDGAAVEIWAALERARNVAGEGSYMEEAYHGKGKGVKSVCAGVRVGRGLGIFHKFAQGLGNLDVFDGRKDCELVAAESSSEDVGSTLGLLSRTAVGAWSLSALRVVLRRERSLMVPRGDADDACFSRDCRDRRGTSRGGESSTRRSNGGRGSERRRRRRRKRSSKEKKGRGTRGRRTSGEKDHDEQEDTEALDAGLEYHRQYTLALSAVKGAGWSGTWVFRVTIDAETDEVWFETKLAQRRGAFGATPGGDQVARVTRVNQEMLARANKHASVLRTREEQFLRVSSLARTRAREAKELARDRILNPDKYKRVHRYMREDSHTTGGASARPARWGEERRRNDIRLK